jgi:hypothetical protein
LSCAAFILLRNFFKTRAAKGFFAERVKARKLGFIGKE